MANILITGGRAPAALELSRQFAGGGHRVVVADSAPLMLCAASRSVAKAARVSEPKTDPRRFAADLAALVVAEQIDLVIPTCEEVFYIGRFKKDFAARVFCPDFAVLTELHDKGAFAAAVTRTNGFGSAVRAPESWRIEAVDDLPQIPAQDLVLKPVFSRFAVETMVRPSAAAAQQIDATPRRPWLAQRCIEGREFCCYAIVVDGQVTALSTYEPTWRAGKGAGIYFEPHTDAGIAAFVAGLARHYHLTGQVAFDFIVQKDGQIFVLECNPRATSGVHLFPGGLPAAFFGKAVAAASTPRMVMSAMLPFGLGALCLGRDRTISVRRLFRDVGRARDVIWSWQDPWPAFHAMAGTSFFLWQALRHRVSATAATTLDIAWDGGEIT